MRFCPSPCFLLFLRFPSFSPLHSQRFSQHFLGGVDASRQAALESAMRKAAWYCLTFLPCVTLPAASVVYFLIDDLQGETRQWAELLNLAFAISGLLAMPLWSRYMDTEKSERLARWLGIDPRDL